MKSKILKFEIFGMIFISILGSLLHFIFEWLNRFWLVGAFSAVNESTWEHLKLAVMPAILWMIIERIFLKEKLNNFFFAKAISIYLMPLFIIILFYSYTAILGYNLLFIDISTFIISVVIGQIVSYKIMSRPGFSQKYENISFWAIVIILFLFIIFTFYPPKFFLFREPIYGQYGIIK